MSRPVFNRPVEYDPSLLRQQQQLQAHQQTLSRPVSREQAMKNEFGFDVEEKTGGGVDSSSVEQSVSRINRVDDDEDAAADEEELERLAEQVQAAREAQMVSSPTHPLISHVAAAVVERIETVNSNSLECHVMCLLCTIACRDERPTSRGAH